VVYPLIQESEVLDYKDLMDGYESIAERFSFARLIKISIVHATNEACRLKNFEMQRFVKRAETQIMVGYYRSYEVARSMFRMQSV